MACGKANLITVPFISLIARTDRQFSARPNHGYLDIPQPTLRVRGPHHGPANRRLPGNEVVTSIP